ncbi:translocon-associated protein subunit delta [Aplysia californica]|uniref:Translocon-associated protein subunit delta n=1 Tax=Aplysia californica TaxID=6500 RepID=A0ABM0JBK9_APLCA|nr:translocon-associated protein subunit delta [Aplysia californica]
MAATGKVLVVIGLFLLPVLTYGDTCLAPHVKSQTYSTPEAIVSTETVLIVEFTVTCKNGLKNINLYADIGGRTLPATKTSEANKYQISITDEHKKLPSGSYNLRIFDEEGFAALRKAQRSGESTDSLKPLFTITMSHPGIWSGPMVQSEFVAAMSAIVVWWLAYTARSKLLA